MGKLILTVLVATAGCLIPPSSRTLPLVVEVRPVTGEQVVLHIDRSDSLHFRATALGLRVDDRRLIEFVAPGTLEITGGEGELQLRSAEPGVDFALGFKPRAARDRREFEARGQHAVIRVRAGQVAVEAETMTMRERRAP